MFGNILLMSGIAVPVIFALVIAIIIVNLRVVVPTNMVHIVQSSKKTTPYGRGKEAGNTYYAWPSWIPVIGITVTKFPESIFQVNLSGYAAYDQARLPFMVDVTAFFRIEKADIAAQRVESFQELTDQLDSVLQGSVRRILATNTLELIMESRSELGEQFTREVTHQISEWGVTPVKTIEFMDIKDSQGSQVIANIMAKEKSRIEKESRVAVAANNQEAQLKEIDATRTVEVQRQDAEQQVGLRTAEKNKEVGIADELAKQSIQEQNKITTEKNMAVLQVEQTKRAEISREVAVVGAEQEKSVKTLNAEADKTVTERRSEADLYVAQQDALGIKARGEAAAEAEKLMLMAPVDAQVTLAKEIGNNEGYQKYLITIKQVEVSGTVGIEMAKAMQNAELKVIANAGDPQQGIAKIGDLFTTAGGTNLTGMLTALAQTDAGKAVINRITG